MELTKEMQEMMERTMEQYFAAYWEKHATPEQEEKRKAEGKTFAGAYAFAKSIAHKMKRQGECVAMPDDLAYWILMEYMEHEKEGAEYHTAEEIEAEAKRKEAEAERKRKAAEEEAEKKRKELESRAAKMNEGSMISVSVEELAAAEAKKKAAEEAKKAISAQTKAEKAKAEAIAKKIEEAQLTLF